MSRKIVCNQMIAKFYNYILLIMLSVMLISCNNNDEAKSNTDISLKNNDANKNRVKNNLKGNILEKRKDPGQDLDEMKEKLEKKDSEEMLKKIKKIKKINSIINSSAIFIEAEKDAILYANMYCQYMIAMKNNNKELATQYQNEAKKIHQQIYPKYLDSKRPETVIFKEKAEELADACMRELKK